MGAAFWLALGVGSHQLGGSMEAAVTMGTQAQGWQLLDLVHPVKGLVSALTLSTSHQLSITACAS